ncbi:MAG: hypothetical protein ACWGOY_14080 [Anaerolineales bacterium]
METATCWWLTLIVGILGLNVGKYLLRVSTLTEVENYRILTLAACAVYTDSGMVRVIESDRP